MNKLIFISLAITAMLAVGCGNSPKNDESKEEGCASTGCAGCASACSQEKTVGVDEIADSDVAVLYFHGTRRCATCEAVEKVAKETMEQGFLEKVAFVSINRERESDLVKKYEISGQTLLVVKGDKKVDLTKDAFLNARTNPEKFGKKLTATIDDLLK